MLRAYSLYFTNIFLRRLVLVSQRKKLQIDVPDLKHDKVPFLIFGIAIMWVISKGSISHGQHMF